MNFIPGLNIKERRIIWLGIASIIILCAVVIYQQVYPEEKGQTQKEAMGNMEEMLIAVSGYCEENAIIIDTINDPSKTGLIGPEWTGIATTIGHPEAKRTTIQADFASLMVELLNEAGTEKNDTIALGCSGSFPGLMLATLSAAKAMGLHCKTIISIGASSFGATRSDFNILDIYNLLLSKDLLVDPPLAVSLGGENDSGGGWDERIRDSLIREIEKSGYKLIKTTTLEESVMLRVNLYGFDHNSGIKAFVNAGGAMANIGSSETILGLKPGVMRKFRIPEADKQGIIHKALQNSIPVIHLLNIKGLAIEYGLKWDPVVKSDE